MTRRRAAGHTLLVVLLMGPLVGGSAFWLAYATMAGLADATASGPLDLLIAMLFFYVMALFMLPIFIFSAYFAGAIPTILAGLLCVVRILCSRQPSPPPTAFALAAAVIGLLPMVYWNALWSLEAWSDWFVQFKVAGALAAAVVCARVLQQNWPKQEAPPASGQSVPDTDA